ncbi:MAG TPA: acyltransferase [Pseudonocardia sp.]|nr:acyltransferase [Pseudonocardia sp.]
MSVGYPEPSATVLEGASAASGSSAPGTTRSSAPDVSAAGSRASEPSDATRLAKQSRVRQIDALRVLSCFSVITVHAVGGPFPVDSVGLGETNFLLHYSREVFFFVSALVLVRTYYPRLGPNGRLPDETGFRLRRLRTIGVPYLWWTSLYLAVSIFHTRHAEPFSQTLDDLPLRWLYLVATGNGSYHMYFLLVTLQYAVVFPVVLRVLRHTQGRHGRVLAASALLQVATLACYHWALLPDDGWRGLLGDASLPAYQLWLVGGAIAGLHLEQWHSWVVAHRRWALGALPVAAAVLLWVYWAQVPSRGGLGASSPLQPIMIFWSVAALGVLYLLAVWIMERGAPGLRNAFSYLAQLSFGVYLAHPMVLDFVLAVLRRTGLMAPSVWVSLIALLCTVALTVAVCSALHRTPLSLPLMGRARLAPARAPQPRLQRLRTRLVSVPTAVLAVSVLAVLLVSGDQTPPADTGTPSWEETVEASDPVPPTGDTDCSTDPTTAAALALPLDCSDGVQDTPEASSAASASGAPGVSGG